MIPLIKVQKLIFKKIQADPSSQSVKLLLAFCMVLVIIKFVIFLLNRPTVDQCLSDDFITQGYMPSRLSLSCLTMPPRLDPRLNIGVIDVRRPLGDLKRDVNSIKIQGGKAEPVNPPATADAPLPAVPSGPSLQQLLRDLEQQLLKLLTSKPNERVPFLMGTIFF
jgi:polo-like kinase 1